MTTPKQQSSTEHRPIEQPCRGAFSIAMAVVLAVLMAGTNRLHAQEVTTDRDRLGMALEYFQNEKYHEALLLFERLEKQYTLNPRYHAYMGVCLFHEWDYEKAARKLSQCLPKLEALAPQERSVYYFTCAESYFFLQRYREAIAYYEQMLLLCFDNEKADALFRLGFCHMQLANVDNAIDYLQAAQDYYQRFPHREKTARLTQIGNMIKGLKRIAEQDKDKKADAEALPEVQGGEPTSSEPETTPPPTNREK